MPAARAHEERRRALAERVVLAAFGLDVADGAADGVRQVDLALDQVVPRRRGRVLEVRHEDVRARVERVDDHLAVDRAGDLDAAIERGRRAAAPPSSRPRAPRAVSGRKAGALAARRTPACRTLRAASRSASGAKPAEQIGHEGERRLV